MSRAESGARPLPAGQLRFELRNQVALAEGVLQHVQDIADACEIEPIAALGEHALDVFHVLGTPGEYPS